MCIRDSLSVSHRPVFLLNSCLSLFSAACSRRHPFSRSYGAILPSSLTMLLPPALGFSPHLPVSVYGTGTVRTIAAFLGTWLTRFPTLLRSASRLRIVWRICLPYSYLACTRLSFPRPCSPHTSPQFCLTAVQESPPAVPVSYTHLISGRIPCTIPLAGRYRKVCSL